MFMHKICAKKSKNAYKSPHNAKQQTTDKCESVKINEEIKWIKRK